MGMSWKSERVKNKNCHAGCIEEMDGEADSGMRHSSNESHGLGPVAWTRESRRAGRKSAGNRTDDRVFEDEKERRVEERVLWTGGNTMCRAKSGAKWTGSTDFQQDLKKVSSPIETLFLAYAVLFREWSGFLAVQTNRGNREKSSPSIGDFLRADTLSSLSSAGSIVRRTVSIPLGSAGVVFASSGRFIDRTEKSPTTVRAIDRR